MFVALEEIGGAHVRRQHAFLDQPMRVVAMARHDLLDLALRIADDVGLGRVEVDCTALLSRRVQGLVDAIEILQLRQQVGALGRFRPLGIRQHGSDFRVREARRRVHHGRIELICLDLAAGGDHHVADQHAAVDLRIERTQSVRELFRSIGITRRGKYTEVLRSSASTSSGSFGRT